MITKASDLDWDEITHFSPNEWPSGTLDQMNASVIWALSRLRNRLPQYHYMVPSPLYEAHVRQSGGGRHSINEGDRLSDATDFFMSWGTIWKAWEEAIKIEQIGGIGIYMDTKWDGYSRPMMHIDCRDTRLMWVRANGQYFYYNVDPVRFHALLGDYGRMA